MRHPRQRSFSLSRRERVAARSAVAWKRVSSVRHSTRIATDRHKWQSAGRRLHGHFLPLGAGI